MVVGNGSIWMQREEAYCGGAKGGSDGTVAAVRPAAHSLFRSAASSASEHTSQAATENAAQGGGSAA